MTIKWSVDPNVITQNIRAYGNNTIKKVHELADDIAREAEPDMKTNAPWTNRTGNARRTLSTDTEKGDEQTVINFRHGVEYGIWLELKNGGRFSIVSPTVRKYSGVVMRRLRGIGG